MISLLATACAGSREDVIAAYQANQDVESRDFAVTMSQAWSAARAALLWNDATTVIENPRHRSILGTAPAGWGTWGHSMGVWIDPLNARVTRVSVVVSRALATNVGAPNNTWLLNDIERALIHVKRGETLTDEDPD